MSAIENPNLQVAITDPERQLPPGNPFLPPKVASIAEWVGRMQVRTGQLFREAYRSSRDGSVSVLYTVRDRSQQIKEEKPVALLAGIAGTAFALGIAARVWRSKR